ncbi:MAG: non-lysosomal glucosylceramidase [bacterium]|nr:non-lysosomal glucosylceramidase [bacterium]
MDRAFNSPYEGEYLNRVAFPLGGMGAGMICLEGGGTLSHFSLRGQPEIFNQPVVFSALWVKPANAPPRARVLEGPVQGWKVFGMPGTGNGAAGADYGLPRFDRAVFETRFPFATVGLTDPAVPLKVELTGWSPFTPGEANSSSLPVAGLEYCLTNPTGEAVEAIYSFHARNFLAGGRGAESAVLHTRGGFILLQKGTAEQPGRQAAFSATVDDLATKVNCAWFRGGGFDVLTMLWKTIREGAMPKADPYDAGPPSPGGSLFLPIRFGPGESMTVRLRLAWHVPDPGLRVGKGLHDDEEEAAAKAAAEAGASCAAPGCACDGAAPAESPRKYRPETYRPFYSGMFDDIEALTAWWGDNYDALRARSKTFADCFYDTTLPPEVVEAVAANLTILKTPTVLRQTDGRLWCWEGCSDANGCCHGSCTHVWNYAQAIPHLFPDMERSLRQTEFGENQDERGHQTFRATLPIRVNTHGGHAASDGQLGGIMKVYRDWRVSGMTEWLRGLWPRVRQSMDFCIDQWDPNRRGILEAIHHNTYDIEFWGPDGMCGSFYLGALRAAALMGRALGEDAALYEELYGKGRAFLENELYNGEYFIQQIRREDPTEAEGRERTPSAGRATGGVPEAEELVEREGPKYQYGNGCLSDGVLGAWIARVCGVGEILDVDKERSHLESVHKYNFRNDLSDHDNPQRPSYAVGHEGGLLLCTWPKGGELSLPFIYSNEVWTGIEYQVASHLMLMGRVEEGLEIVRAARARYDGRVRNPFDEYECGHWYGRALSSYALLQGLTGARYDAVEKTLYLEPNIKGDFRAFFCAAGGYGTVGVRNGKPFLEVAQGKISIEIFKYTPCVKKA